MSEPDIWCSDLTSDIWCSDGFLITVYLVHPCLALDDHIYYGTWSHKMKGDIMITFYDPKKSKLGTFLVDF